MSAAWVEAIGTSVAAVAVVAAAARWAWRTSRRYAKARADRQRDKVIGIVVPFALATLVLAVLISRDKK